MDDDAGVPHFVLIPFMAQGHMIPMLDIARLLASRGALVSIVTTPANAARISSTIDRIAASGLPVRFVTLEFPSAEVGLPDGCENFDSIPTRDLVVNFFRGTKLLRAPLVRHLRDHSPQVSCVVSDFGHTWAHEVAVEFGVPRLVFHGYCSFALLCLENLFRHKTYEAIASGSEPFVLSGIPQRIEITRNQLPRYFRVNAKYREISVEIRESEVKADGVIVNSFQELEPGYVKLLESAAEKKVWTIGPVSLSANGLRDMAERGNKAAIDEDRCLSWLDSKEPGSVIYVSFGSTGNFPPSQLMELGLGLRATGRPFIWVFRSVQKSSEFERWLSETFDDGESSNCLVIKGWAPQVMILSHRAVGGFVTHCGWNSTLEAVCAGVPMITWPLLAEQFLNEKLVVEVLGIGFEMGVKEPTDWSGAEEKKDEVVAIRKEAVVKAVERLMDGGVEGEAIRNKAKELRLKARMAVEEGGSSHTNIGHLIQHVASQQSINKIKVV